MMKKLLLFLLFSVSLTAQKTETINFKQNIKDIKSLTKSLTLIDNRPDKEIGKVTQKSGEVEIKFADDDLKTFVQNWFLDDNKQKGNNDIVVMLEDLKVYDEQSPNDKYMFGKAKIKISSFIKRNDRYYFINRFDNVIINDPRNKSGVARFLAQSLSDIITEFITASYTNSVLSYYIPENEINNYEAYLSKNYKAFNNSDLKDGVYLNFKSFYTQEPAPDYHLNKNKKGKVTSIKNRDDLSISYAGTFCYVDQGKAYKFTPSGFKDMIKDSKGFYIVTSRDQLFAENKSGGIIIGAMAGGLVGATIGAAIDSGSNRGSVKGFGYRSATISNVYVDSLTGTYIFEK